MKPQLLPGALSSCAHTATTYLQLLVRVLLRVLAPLALLTELLQLSLTLVQSISFAPLLCLVFLQCSLGVHETTRGP